MVVRSRQADPGSGEGATLGDRGRPGEERPIVPSDVPVIRPAGIGDISRMADIEWSSFDDPWSAEAFEVALTRPEVRVTVAELAGGAAPGAERPEAAAERVVAGYLVAWFVADEGEVANVAVEPACRRRGVAAALLDDLLHEAHARSAESVYLEVRASNRGAQALYASRGFRRVGRRRGYYSSPVEDALILRWDRT